MFCLKLGVLGDHINICSYFLFPIDRLPHKYQVAPSFNETLCCSKFFQFRLQVCYFLYSAVNIAARLPSDL